MLSEREGIWWKVIKVTYGVAGLRGFSVDYSRVGVGGPSGGGI